MSGSMIYFASVQFSEIRLLCCYLKSVAIIDNYLIAILLLLYINRNFLRYFM